MYLGILLTGGPFDSERWRTAYEVGRAALDRGHEVSYFHYLDGTLVPVEGQSLPDCSPASIYDEMPVEKFRELVAAGAEVVCCGLCVDARAIDHDDYPEGVAVGLLPDLADQLGEADRVISL